MRSLGGAIGIRVRPNARGREVAASARRRLWAAAGAGLGLLCAGLGAGCFTAPALSCPSDECDGSTGAATAASDGPNDPATTSESGSPGNGTGEESDGGTDDSAMDDATDSAGGSTTDDARCGNAVIEAGEECDFGTLGEQTCETQGFAGGVLGCNTNCTFDTSACEVCGNGIVEPGEVCDGPVEGISCAAFGFGGRGNAEITCNETCDGVVAAGCQAFICDADPLVTMGPCPAGCDCSGGREACLVECTSEQPCADEIIDCPAGRECAVFCTGAGACTGLQVRADAYYRVEVICSGADACGSVDLNCEGSFGQCFLNCNAQPSGMCTGSHVTCGYDDCGFKCTDVALADGTVDCGEACGCEVCGTPAG